MSEFGAEAKRRKNFRKTKIKTLRSVGSRAKYMEQVFRKSSALTTFFSP